MRYDVPPLSDLPLDIAVEHIHSRHMLSGVFYANPSPLAFDGKNYLFYRHWTSRDHQSTRIRVCEYGEKQAIEGTDRLVDFAPYDKQEDPRTFLFRGKPVVLGSSHWRLYLAELNDDLTTNRVRMLVTDNMTTTEKNWNPFVYEDRLFFVYTVEPHVVMEATEWGEKEIYCKKVHSTDLPLNSWKAEYGALRSSTPPVLIDDKWYTFFHSSNVRKELPPILAGADPSLKRYYTGFYCFENKPPFKMLSLTPAAILHSPIKHRTWMGMSSVAFATGAVYRPDAGKWDLYCGIQDMEMAKYTFKHRQLVEHLK